ncbi:prolyl 4-hydroxylase subunit alpha-3 isoform X2 [Dromaius novaehollandiae]|uniref:prolyl 4-hydroxylase subunit alpha-3 isoform X2 n=1 Tax=Dromaius novaehollandiae TaxID=8790 RepID=UPI00311E9438
MGALGVLGLGVLLAWLPPAPAETFSAMLSIRQALGAEGRLLRLLRAYLQQESDRLSDLARFYNKVQALHQEPAASVDNPLLAFGLIKRLRSDWLNVVYSEAAGENTQELQTGFEALRQELPGPEDLDGAARALMRLQDVYALSVKGLAKGVFEPAGAHSPLYHPGQPIALSADDCFHVGKVAYDTGDYYHSIAWLEEAVDLFRLSYGSWNTEDRASLEDALDHLAFSYFMVGNVSHALSLSRELLRYDPGNLRVARNVAQYEKLLEEREVPAEPGPPRRPDSTRLQTRDAYEELCRRPGTQHPPPSLRCAYETHGSPYLLLQPAKRETVRLQPYVALYHDFVSDAEAETVKALAGPWLQRSVVASGEEQQKAEYRISKSAWLKDTADPAVAALERRIAAVTGLDVRVPYAEYLQVVNYGLGGHYEPHFDHATSRKSPLYRMKSGNRIATVMIYLSSVEAGGSTAFIYANFSVPVVKNAALFWWNLRRSGEGDGDTLHAACPVLAGDKWVANKWIHEHGQEFRRPCGLRPED